MKNAQSFGDSYEEIMKKNAKTKLQLQLQTEEVNARIKETQNKMSTLNKTKAKPEVTVKDNASKTIDGIKDKLSGLKKIVGIGSAILGGAGAIGAGAAMAKTFEFGSDLERQMVSIQHFMQVNNKGKSQSQIQNMSHDYLMQVRKNADITPFETNDVVSAGTRALTVDGEVGQQTLGALNQKVNSLPEADDNVKQVQQNLNTIMDAGLTVDGIAGQATKVAIMRFQGIMGLTQDGIVGPMTTAATTEVLSKTTCSRGSTKQYAVRFIQWKLGCTVDDQFDWNTTTAVQNFQVKNGLTPDGIVGPLTFAALLK